MNHTEIIPLSMITDIDLEEGRDSMKIETKNKKFQFVYVLEPGSHQNNLRILCKVQVLIIF